MKPALTVRTRSKNYPIFVSACGVGGVFGDLARRFAGRRLVVVTDTTVAKLYRRAAEKALADQGVVAPWVVFPAGEKYKTRKTKEQVEDALLAQKADRKTLLVAFGGGVVGDLTGFVAATLLRGLDFVQVPTTLLSMVDSSVGGKTGVDTAHGKNLIGAFWQPEAVYADTLFLNTLPKEEILSGLGEVLKYGFIGDRAFDGYLAAHVKEVLALEPKVTAQVLRKSIDHKRRVVGRDERETGGLRRTLNFGHTAGHAVELLSKFRLPHGHCVAIGMAVEAQVSCDMGLLKDEDRRTLMERLTDYGLPTRVPPGLKIKDLYGVMLSDKKSSATTVKAALITSIGKSAKGPAGDYALAVPREVWDKAFSSLAIK